jgi:hypothetical protein
VPRAGSPPLTGKVRILTRPRSLLFPLLIMKLLTGELIGQDTKIPIQVPGLDQDAPKTPPPGLAGLCICSGSPLFIILFCLLFLRISCYKDACTTVLMESLDLLGSQSPERSRIETLPPEGAKCALILHSLLFSFCVPHTLLSCTSAA